MWYMNDERRQLQKMARDFAVSEVKPFVREMEEKEAFPYAILKKAGDLGILGLLYTEDVGGCGPRWVDMGIVLEEVAKESNTVAMCIGSMYAGSSSIYYMGTDEQKENILRPIIAGDAVVAGAQCEPSGVAHYEDFQTKLEIIGDECVINGGKIFCTNAGKAKYYTVMCKTAEPIPEGMGSISTVLIPNDAPGFKVGHIENKLGWHGSSTGQIYFNNCRVPRENLLGSFDMRFTDALSGAFGIAILLGAGQLGSAEGVFEKTLRYSKEKKHGETSLFDSYQAMRHQFVDLWMEIETFRGLIYGIMDSLDHGANVLGQAWAAKVKGARMFEYVASQCVVLNGGNGTVVENDIERYYRDAKMNSIGCFALPHITDMLTTLI